MANGKDFYEGNYLLTSPHIQETYVVTDIKTYSDGRMECVIIAILSCNDVFVAYPEEHRRLIIKGDYTLEGFIGDIVE